jgi:hypothetical protein
LLACADAGITLLFLENNGEVSARWRGRGGERQSLTQRLVDLSKVLLWDFYPSLLAADEPEKSTALVAMATLYQHQKKLRNMINTSGILPDSRNDRRPWDRNGH